MRFAGRRWECRLRLSPRVGWPQGGPKRGIAGRPRVPCRALRGEARASRVPIGRLRVVRGGRSGSAALALATAIAAGPVYQAAAGIVHPRQNEEMRPVLEFVRDHWKVGDTLYLHYEAQYAFRYYEECGCLELTHEGRELWPVRALGGPSELAPAIVSKTPALIVGRHYDADSKRYIADLRRLKGRGRVWFLYSHFADSSEKSFIQRDLIGTLNEMGVRLNGIDRTRAHAYLYDLR